MDPETKFDTFGDSSHTKEQTLALSADAKRLWCQRFRSLLHPHVRLRLMYEPYGVGRSVTWCNMEKLRRRVQPQSNRYRPQPVTKACAPSPPPGVVHEKVLTPSPLQRKHSGQKTGKPRVPQRKEKGAKCYNIQLVRYITRSQDYRLCKRICDKCVDPNPDPRLDHTTIDNTLMASGLAVEDSDSDDDEDDDDNEWQCLRLYQKTNKIIDVIIPEDTA